MNFDQNAAYKEAMDQVTLFSSAKQKTQVSFASQKQKEEEAIILKGIEDYKKRNQSRYKKEKEPNSQRSNDSGILGQFKNIFTGQNND